MGVKELLRSSEILKEVPRFGWLQRGVPLSIVESVAEHTFQTALLTLTLCRCLGRRGVKVDTEKALEMAIIHDLPEALLGDLSKTAKDSIGDDIKRSAELKTLEGLLKGTPLEQSLSTYMELDQGVSLEARIVKVADQLSAAVKGLQYARLGYEVDEIVSNTLGEAERLAREDPDLKPCLEMLLAALDELNRYRSVR